MKGFGYLIIFSAAYVSRLNNQASYFNFERTPFERRCQSLDKSIPSMAVVCMYVNICICDIVAVAIAPFWFGVSILLVACLFLSVHFVMIIVIYVFSQSANEFNMIKAMKLDWRTKYLFHVIPLRCSSGVDCEIPHHHKNGRPRNLNARNAACCVQYQNHNILYQMKYLNYSNRRADLDVSFAWSFQLWSRMLNKRFNRFVTYHYMRNPGKQGRCSAPAMLLATKCSAKWTEK